MDSNRSMLQFFMAGTNKELVKYVFKASGMDENVLNRLQAAVNELVNDAPTKHSCLESSFPSPSEVGKSGRSTLARVNEHRAGGDGLHVSLQVKAFGKFMDIVKGEKEVGSLCYQVAGRMALKLSPYLASEPKRKEEFIKEIKNLFPSTVIFQDVTEGRAKSDSTVEVKVGNETFRVCNFEFKNEFAGVTSDPNNQNVGYFVHLQTPYKSERAPMLLVSVIGCHYFQVFGAVWNGGEVCVDPLCSPASLLFVPRDPLGGVAKLGRIISALKETIHELQTYYSCTPVSKRQIDFKGPYFRECTAGKLEYVRKMGAEWLYEAKLLKPSGFPEVVLVKFARFQYGKDAHLCLADCLPQ